MSAIPPAIEALISEHKHAGKALAWLQLDAASAVQGWGGEVQAFGLGRLEKGVLVSEYGLHLDELFPQYEEPFELVDLEIKSGQYSTVYVQTVENGNWIILLDRTEAAKNEQSLRQSHNESRLKKKQMSIEKPEKPQAETPAVVESFCNLMNMLALEQLDDGSFHLLGQAPDDFSTIYPEVFKQQRNLRPDEKFPFVENFLLEAMIAWENGLTKKSGPWVEVDTEGREIAIEVIAKCWNDKKILVLELLGSGYESQHAFLQMGRENVLIRQFLEEEVRKRTASIREREEEIALRLVWAAESRDGGEAGAHIRRLGLYSEAMAEMLDWNKSEIDEIRIAATMHDVGKIGIPDSILRKPGPLTSMEFEIMKTHTSIGGKILDGSEAHLLQMARDIALCHHEKWDGTGYPRGLQGEEIPIAARIVAIADVFDALINKRCYKEAWPIEAAFENMMEEKGKRFDPNLLEVFFNQSERFLDISKNTETPMFEGFQNEDHFF